MVHLLSIFCTSEILRLCTAGAVHRRTRPQSSVHWAFSMYIFLVGTSSIFLCCTSCARCWYIYGDVHDVHITPTRTRGMTFLHRENGRPASYVCLCRAHHRHRTKDRRTCPFPWSMSSKISGRTTVHSAWPFCVARALYRGASISLNQALSFIYLLHVHLLSFVHLQCVYIFCT